MSLDSASAPGPGTASLLSPSGLNFTIILAATGAAGTPATVALEMKLLNGVWVAVGPAASVPPNTTSVVRFLGPFGELRLNLLTMGTATLMNGEILSI